MASASTLIQPHLIFFLLIFYVDRVASFTFHRADAGRWRAHHHVLLHAKKGSGGKNEGEVVTLIHSHHLLDHKPDNMILSGKKFKLRGVACLGRPGVALCIGSPKNIDRFRGKLRGAMPQKKFGSVEIIEAGGKDDDNDSSSATVALLDEVIDGFQEASISELRELLTTVGREDQFFSLLGINNDSPPKDPQSQNSNDNVKESTSKGAGKKKRKGKR